VSPAVALVISEMDGIIRGVRVVTGGHDPAGEQP
jgi:hypothetical protein